ncbi:hypothetical protein [Jiella pelagia]|uniref:Uncharacterized protein n=1 Tax=Jiella pelagia TaxID=2986949 RepID=A0ABY7C2P1_9HYPH|nr:hypothetical protein [Jiella pelagia]WAP70149.1 hypothetical protein OH818_08540 [Jiella pelagia]
MLGAAGHQRLLRGLQLGMEAPDLVRPSFLRHLFIVGRIGRAAVDEEDDRLRGGVFGGCDRRDMHADATPVAVEVDLHGMRQGRQLPAEGTVQGELQVEPQFRPRGDGKPRIERACRVQDETSGGRRQMNGVVVLVDDDARRRHLLQSPCMDLGGDLGASLWRRLAKRLGPEGRVGGKLWQRRQAVCGAGA